MFIVPHLGTEEGGGPITIAPTLRDGVLYVTAYLLFGSVYDSTGLLLRSLLGHCTAVVVTSGYWDAVVLLDASAP